MKLYLYMDEKHDHVYADGKGLHESDARQIPDRLGVELVALRQREESILSEIEDHLRLTGQKPIS